MRRFCAALAVLLGAPGAASAATVETVPTTELTRDGPSPLVEIRIADEHGEASDLTVAVSGTQTSGERTVQVRDGRAPLTAGRGCRAAGEREIRCDVDVPLTAIAVLAGDGDDRVRVAAAVNAVFVAGGSGADDLTGGSRVLGGDGDDRLTASQGAGTLDGGPGDDAVAGGRHGDVLIGGAGVDVLRGGGGDDTLTDGDAAAVGPDVLVGGPGRDTADYAGERRPVVLRLSGAGARRAGEDAVSGIESAIGGEADDVLVGGAGPTLLRGNGGDDRLSGGGGRDGVFGGGGDDRLDGGAGADTVEGHGGADRIRGGRGRDALDGGIGEDRVAGAGGDDRLVGGGEADRLEGGRGHDRIIARGDFFADAVGCGSGRDEALLDRGDRAEGCDELHRAGPRGFLRPRLVRRYGEHARRGGPTYDVERGRATVTLDCQDLELVCDARVIATALERGRRVVVLRASLRCVDAMPDGSGVCVVSAAGTGVLTGAGRRLLARRGTLRARATVHLAPGARRGAIPLRDRLRLRAGRRAGSR